MSIEIVLAVIGSSVLTALVTEMFRRGKTRSESKKSDADADNVVVDTATDLVAQVRIEAARLNCELVAERESNRAEIIALTRTLGQLRQSLQMQSNKIAEMLAERLEVHMDTMTRKERQDHIHDRMRDDLGNLNAMVMALQNDLEKALIIWKATIAIGFVSLICMFIVAFVIKALLVQDLWVVSVVGIVFGIAEYISHNVIVHQVRMTKILMQLYSREANTATLKLLSDDIDAGQA